MEATLNVIVPERLKASASLWSGFGSKINLKGPLKEESKAII